MPLLQFNDANCQNNKRITSINGTKLRPKASNRPFANTIFSTIYGDEKCSDCPERDNVASIHVNA